MSKLVCEIGQFHLKVKFNSDVSLQRFLHSVDKMENWKKKKTADPLKLFEICSFLASLGSQVYISGLCFFFFFFGILLQDGDVKSDLCQVITGFYHKVLESTLTASLNTF